MPKPTLSWSDTEHRNLPYATRTALRFTSIALENTSGELNGANFRKADR